MLFKLLLFAIDDYVPLIFPNHLTGQTQKSQYPAFNNQGTIVEKELCKVQQSYVNLHNSC